MTLAPPDLPRFFDLIAMRIFRNPGVNSSPCNGSICKDCVNSSKSLFMDLYLFASAFNDFANVGVGIISKFIEQLLYCSAWKSTGFHHFCLVETLADSIGQIISLGNRRYLKRPYPRCQHHRLPTFCLCQYPSLIRPKLSCTYYFHNTQFILLMQI